MVPRWGESKLWTTHHPMHLNVNCLVFVSFLVWAWPSGHWHLWYAETQLFDVAWEVPPHKTFTFASEAEWSFFPQLPRERFRRLLHLLGNIFSYIFTLGVPVPWISIKGTGLVRYTDTWVVPEFTGQVLELFISYPIVLQGYFPRGAPKNASSRQMAGRLSGGNSLPAIAMRANREPLKSWGRRCC